MRRHSAGKQLVFRLLLALLVLGVAEAGLHIAYRLARGRPFPSSARHEAIRRVAYPERTRLYNGGEIVAGGAIEVIHPYLGFVLDPMQNANASYLGFPRPEDDPLAPGPAGTVTVAFFGGSFALGLSTTGRDALRQRLLDHGINARVLTIALGGYKQPQQLHALADLLSRGAPLDVVVNIDGFYEVAIPQAENLPKGVNPFYPRAWYYRTLHLSDQPTLRRMARASVLSTRRRRWAAAFSRMPAGSITLYAMWRAGNERLRRQVRQIHEAAAASPAAADSGFMTTGPRVPEADVYPEIAAHWRSCSLLMKALCDARGILYLHFLQPNQYYEPGRALTETERRIAYTEDHSYRPGVVSGYPLLIEEGARLAAAGVSFHDLTFIYRDLPGDIYEDDCCHPNPHGYGIAAGHVARAIASAFAQRGDLQDVPIPGNEVE